MSLDAATAELESMAITTSVLVVIATAVVYAACIIALNPFAADALMSFEPLI